jgi:hypothetical protein
MAERYGPSPHGSRLRRTKFDDENTNKAKGNAAYFGRGTIYSPGYERETTITPPGKKREKSKLPSIQKAARRRMNGPQ